MGRLLRSLWVCAALGGCNHLFYHPTQVVYRTPDSLNIRYQEFAVTSGDGVALSFWRLRHQQAPQLGTVLHFHGNAQNMTAHFLYIWWLTHYGFDVVTFDYRGYGKSAGAPDRLGTIRDGQAALRYLAKEDVPTYVLAQSLGGAIAIPALATVPVENLRAIAIESSFASYRRVARDKVASFFITWPFQYPLSWLISSHLDAEDFAPEVTTPSLVIQGDHDPVVPFQEGRRIFEALGATDKQFWRLQGGGHTVAFADDESPLRRRLLDYFCKYHPTPEQCQAIVARIPPPTRPDPLPPSAAP